MSKVGGVPTKMTNLLTAIASIEASFIVKALNTCSSTKENNHFYDEVLCSSLRLNSWHTAGPSSLIASATELVAVAVDAGTKAVGQQR